MGWIDLAENRDSCRALVKELMKHRALYNGEIFLISRESVSF